MTGIKERLQTGVEGSLIYQAPQARGPATLTAPTPASLRLPAAFVHHKTLSAGTPHTGNALVHSENLIALTHLAATLAGSVRCIYIDPPYNNQERYRHYDDVGGHDEWLSMISARLTALKPLLAPDGSIWISIDDREAHYLKVAADGVFGRQNFVTTIVWQQRTTRENRKAFSNNHEYILVYASDAETFRRTRNAAPASQEVLARYRNPDGDPRGAWQSVSANVQDGHATVAQHYELVAPNGRRHRPPEGRCWVYTAARMADEIAAGRVWFGKDGKGVPRLKQYLDGTHKGLTPETLWLAGFAGTNDEAKKHLLSIFPDRPVFDTPKPERLIGRILEIATEPGDLVMDVFLGSGTTAAVAHKLNRRYVGVEQAEAAIKLSADRLRSVIAGEAGGVSASSQWTGGGGFDFYRIG